jgi:hypothetical protein
MTNLQFSGRVTRALLCRLRGHTGHESIRMPEDNLMSKARCAVLYRDSRRQITVLNVVLIGFLLLTAPWFASHCAAEQATILVSAERLECPSNDFRAFSSAFAESTVVQKRFTRFPLEYRFLDTTTIDTEEKIRLIASFDEPPFKFGFFPNRGYRSSSGLEIKTEIDIKSGVGDLILFKPDTDAVVVFRFHRDGGCWVLYQIDNKTL